ILTPLFPPLSRRPHAIDSGQSAYRYNAPSSFPTASSRQYYPRDRPRAGRPMPQFYPNSPRWLARLLRPILPFLPAARFGRLTPRLVPAALTFRLLALDSLLSFSIIPSNNLYNRVLLCCSSKLFICVSSISLLILATRFRIIAFN